MRAWPFRILLVILTVFVASWIRAEEPARGEVHVHVTDASNGKPLPCRLTILDPAGEMAPVKAPTNAWLAVRPGVVYTGTGEAVFTLPAGAYTLHATRGLEYGLVTRRLDVGSKVVEVSLRLAREVDTTGYVSCDTHIHTLTYSGHGDATVQERMATIAGEGIELAVATDHNHHTDYAPVARETQTTSWFTPVIGNEVTTKQGHFNAFPILPGSAVPDYQQTDWSKLLPAIRAVPGVRVVVLNHPSNDHSGFIPTDPVRFHPASGESRDGRPWSFDGIEVVTSAALQSDWMKPYRDWFALLNYGIRTAGIGSSDSHEVNRFILGQGRTYIASKATEADRIDIQEACDSILGGKVLVSMGLFTEAWVDDRYGPGDLTVDRNDRIKLRVRIQGPRWIGADRLDVFIDGEKVATRAILHKPDAVVKDDLILSLPRPKHDAWIVPIASGPGVSEPYWPIPRPYQPNRADWEPRVIGSTDPIRVDGDGDGRYTAPRQYARTLLDSANGSPDRLMEALRPYDTAVAVQAASLFRERGGDLDAPTMKSAIDKAAQHVRHGFVAYRALLR